MLKAFDFIRKIFSNKYARNILINRFPIEVRYQGFELLICSLVEKRLQDFLHDAILDQTLHGGIAKLTSQAHKLPM